MRGHLAAEVHEDSNVAHVSALLVAGPHHPLRRLGSRWRGRGERRPPSGKPTPGWRDRWDRWENVVIYGRCFLFIDGLVYVAMDG